MKTMVLVLGGFIATVALSSAAFAEEAGGFQIQSGDKVRTVLERSTGQTVGLRVGSGEEIRGKIGRVGDHVVHLTELSGREFFDAVVPLDAIEAVVIKARSK